LGDLIRAVQLERNRSVLEHRVSLIEGVGSQRAARSGVDDLLESPEALEALVELERGDQVIVVVGNRIRDRALVAVVGREVEAVVELVFQPTEDRVVGDGTFDEVQAGISRQAGAFGREEVFHHDDATTLPLEHLSHQIATNESGAADDEDRRAGELLTGQRSLPGRHPYCGAPSRRCGNVRWMPRGCYQPVAGAAPPAAGAPRADLDSIR